MNSVTPSAGQLKIIREVTNWYNTDTSQFLILTGAGGTGKTTLLKHIQQAITASGEMLYDAAVDKQEAAQFLAKIDVTATQNDPVSNLIDNGFENAKTIYSYLRLQVKPNHTGGYEVTQAYNHDRRMAQIRSYQNTLLVVDEVSHLDEFVFNTIRQTNLRCILMGDAAQLLSISSTPFSVFDKKHGIKTIELTENFRAQSPALKEANERLHEAVMKGLEVKIDHNGDDIIICNDSEFKEAIRNHARNAPDTDSFKILTYKKALFVKYNQYIRKSLNLPIHPIKGDILVVNERYYRKTDDSSYLRPSERIEYLSLTHDSATSQSWEEYNTKHIHGDEYEEREGVLGMPLSIEEKLVNFRYISRRTGRLNIKSKIATTVKLAKDRAEIIEKLKSQSKQNAEYNKSLPIGSPNRIHNPWGMYYAFKECVLDYRFSYAENTHKAQGRTYPVVFIDLPDLFTASNPDTIRRLVYVAFSRASEKVYVRRPN